MAKTKKKSKTGKVSILNKPISFAIIVGAIAAGITGIIKAIVGKKK